jgi:hypothetical protein
MTAQGRFSAACLAVGDRETLPSSESPPEMNTMSVVLKGEILFHVLPEKGNGLPPGILTLSW